LNNHEKPQKSDETLIYNMHIYYKPLKLNEGAIKNAEANI
jgi:hypothetical protein